MFDLRGLLPARRVSPLMALTALLALTLPPAIQAQSLSYTTVGKVEFGGTMGMMMRMVPDAQADQRQTIHIKGTRMRMDNGDTSTITDMTDGRYTMLDHEAKTFYSVTAEDMQAQMEQAQEQMAAYGEDPMAEAGPTEEGSYELKISTDRAGRARDFDGYSAEQVLMTMELVPKSPEAVEAAAMTGRTVFFTELWISTDFPGATEYREAQEKMGEAFLESGGGGMAELMSQALAGNPNMKDALETNWAEMKDMEGVPVRTVTHMVSVPAGMEFDPDAVLAAADQPLEAGEMPSAQDAAMEAAKGAMGRRLGGLLGRGKKEEKEPEAPTGPAVQTITMRSVSTIEEIRTDALPDDLFQPPANYTERRPEWMKGG